MTREKDFHKQAVESLRREYDTIQSRLSALLDLRLDRSITKDEYDIKARELKQRQLEISVMTGNHEKGDDNFKTTVEALFSLASKAYDIFESSKIEQKRQLISFVFSNLALKGAKLEYSLRNPFHLMAGRHTHQDWLHILDSIRTDYYTPMVQLRPIFEQTCQEMGLAA